MVERYRRYRAPANNNSLFTSPPLADIRVEAWPAPPVTIAGQPLAELRTAAREQLCAAISEWTGKSCNWHPQQPLVLTGHQAELFHPGVWVKNFVLAHLAQPPAAGLHLIIDTDQVTKPAIRVPTGTIENPRVETIAFDQLGEAIPVEEWRIRDSELFRTFADRVAETIRPMVTNPLITEFWPSVMDAAGQDDRAGWAIARARHQLESEWLGGQRTCELPMSYCCQLPAFYDFLWHLVQRADETLAAYNQSLAAYRQAHRLRSDAQPMPNLAVEGDWHESPFWVWQQDRPTRRELWGRRDAGNIELSDRDAWAIRLESECATEQLAELASQGVRIRTRALTTTLFARLVLGDLFLHGIGGAKYDEVTDGFCEQLFGCRPAPYVAVSATLRLPIEHPTVTPSNLTELRHQLRDLEFHAENHLPADLPAEVKSAVQTKQEWIATPKSPENAAARHQAIAKANEVLQQAVAEKREQLLNQEESMQDQVRASQVLDSREYSFVLFPQQDLQERIEHLLPGAGTHGKTG